MGASYIRNDVCKERWNGYLGISKNKINIKLRAITFVNIVKGRETKNLMRYWNYTQFN